MKKEVETPRFYAYFEDVQCEDGKTKTFTGFGDTEEIAVRNLYLDVLWYEESKPKDSELCRTKRLNVIDLKTAYLAEMTYDETMFHYIFAKGRVSYDEMKHKSLGYKRAYPNKLYNFILEIILKNNGFEKDDFNTCQGQPKVYYRTHNEMHIYYNNDLRFHIDPKNRLIGMGMYAICATKDGQSSSLESDMSSSFYARLFSLLNGEITAEELINKITA